MTTGRINQVSYPRIAALPHKPGRKTITRTTFAFPIGKNHQSRLSNGHGYCTAFSPVHFPLLQIGLTERLISFVFFVGTPLGRTNEREERTQPPSRSTIRQVASLVRHCVLAQSTLPNCVVSQ